MGGSFGSIGAFVAHMQGRIATLPAAQTRALEAASDIVLIEAKSLPGTYQAGWPKLKPETVSRKATGDSPLLETGAMRDSYARKVMGPTAAAVGSDKDEALWQELGTSRGNPPRPVLKAAGIRKGGEAARIICETVGRHLGGSSNR